MSQESMLLEVRHLVQSVALPPDHFIFMVLYFSMHTHLAHATTDNALLDRIA